MLPLGSAACVFVCLNRGSPDAVLDAFRRARACLLHLDLCKSLKHKRLCIGIALAFTRLKGSRGSSPTEPRRFK